MNLSLFPEPDVDLAGDDARATLLMNVARALADRLASGTPVSRQLLKTLISHALGGSDACGDWSMREAYDALEAAQVLLMLREGGARFDSSDPAAALAAHQRLLALLPTQTYRSENQVDLQQFSTPIDLAWMATRAARLQAVDTVLEPSAGTGMLAVHARQQGAALFLNERDPARAALLAQVLGAEVSRHDAEFIDDNLGEGARPSVVLINPPFSRSESRGRDRHAGARHLRSALMRLASGGRCVAIMSPAFAKGGTDARGYEAVAEIAVPRWEMTLGGQPFAKHGTGIAVRLLVYDKGWSGPSETYTAQSLKSALPLIEAIPERLELGDSVAIVRLVPVPRPVLSKPAAAVSLLAGLGSRRPAAPPPKPVISDVAEPLVFEALEEPPAHGDPVGVYVPWRLTRFALPEPKPHPDQLVESMAMSSILPPAAIYRPTLPPCAVATLSDAQLETVIYAGQAFSRDLPGRFLPNEAGTLLRADAEGHVYRAGFMVGDGTGVGKGRQIAACILDRWCQGQRRAVWISKSAALLEDARRDWSALGGLAIDVQPLDAFTLGSSIPMDRGILFLTFATLRSQRDDVQSRLQQILSWLGADFDGVIAFDEAHELANAAGTETKFGTQKGSEQGLAGVRLQNLLPRACILYNSATGATDPANLCYASRLGLWGNAAFETREAFMSAIGEGGIAAMEIVARDLKALGHYTARALTFQGVEYDPLEHRLSPEQIAIYDAYADGWAIIHRNLHEVLAATNIVDRFSGKALNAQAKGAALSRFESAKQRFFGQLLIAMKLPTLLAAIEKDVGEGRHVVVQLVTTSEAILHRHLATLSADERAQLDIELSPREYMIQYLENAFPTRQMKVFKGPDDEPRSELMVDEAGNPIHSKEALRRRGELIEQLCALPAIPGALDELIRHFGTDSVAEVTGRTRRLVPDVAGRQRVDRRTARSNLVEAEAFMTGEKRILVFSDAGGTGRSYHADRNCPTADRRRVHYLLEPGWRASSAIQGLGRTNRTNQASAPIFRPVTTDCRGERRFISTIARRLDSLGALTRGQRQTGGQNLFDPADNLESDYARDALSQWYSLLYRGKLASTSLTEFTEMTGLKLIADDGGALLDDLPPIQRWLNRLLALRIGTQNAIFEEYLALIEARIDAARERGTLDVGVETIAVEKIEVLDEQVLRRDPASGAETRLARLALHRRRRARSLADVLAGWSGSDRTAYLRNTRSGRIALRAPSWSILDNDGEAIQVWELIRPGGSERIRETRLAESSWTETDEATFHELWSAECAEIEGRVEVDTINIATGLLLPVWNRLPDDDLRVWRICDNAGISMLGRIISPAGFEKVAQAFGVAMAISLSPAELVDGARGGGGVAVPYLPPARLVRSYVNEDVRLEIRDFPASRLAWLKSLGCFTEIIAYKTRLFVPINRGVEILALIEAAMSDLGAAA
ncbi:strawberry notch family protein [Novosphingobium sp. G106]|uniref:strawberry notch-like NTP hydrolase domain-containing protein n=1 Tax=Novosphingobium sp. G106 TaxID=2849500 RepID=UPI001C2D4820|nr:strawberry notch family protein [Novosphingobium sp. G106]MBV1686421.1 strawberry notch family protein [Novosphingobium sp. G106]